MRAVRFAAKIRGGRIDTTENYEACRESGDISEGAESCRRRESSPKSRADSLRLMSDKQLARMLCDEVVCECERCFVREKCLPGRNGILRWLNEKGDA